MSENVIWKLLISQNLSVFLPERNATLCLVDTQQSVELSPASGIHIGWWGKAVLAA